MRTLTRKAWSAGFALGLIACQSGCGDDTAGPEPTSGYTDPAALIGAHAAALSERNFGSYESLLAEDFQYFPSEEAWAFPWMEGDPSWSREDELLMIGHMMDPNYSPPDGSSVDRIDASFQVLTTTPEPDGSKVTAHGEILVMWDSNNGASCDTYLEFRLVRGPDGYLRIRSIHEFLMTSVAKAVEQSSWAEIKALYHD